MKKKKPTEDAPKSDAPAADGAQPVGAVDVVAHSASPDAIILPLVCRVCGTTKTANACHVCGTQEHDT